uniref:Solute carrier family 2, facilitated glucose transporter member 5 n=1 Tax=Tetraodon nigroviridis TaxID=99883 RepID=H3CUP9_TETNG
VNARLRHLQLDYPVVVAAIFVSGIGGTFQYGFSISVMTSPSAFINQLVNQTCVHRYGVHLPEGQLSLIWSFMVSIFCVGGLLGSLVASPLLSRFGRKRCLLGNNCVTVAGAVLMLLSTTAQSFEMIMAARFIYGVSAGVGLSVHSIYLLECAPKRLRGMVGVTVATFASFGKFLAQLLGISEFLGTRERWPWLLGFNGFAALLQLSTLPFLPESPRFLLLDRGDQQACERALRKLWGDRDHSREVEEMLEEKAAQQGIRSHSVLELMRNRSLRWQLLTVLVSYLALQLCGINAVYFYLFAVLRAAGIKEHQLRYAALGTGLCETVTSVACFLIIEKTGKKVLLLRGYTGMSAVLILLTITLYFQKHVSWLPYCSLVLIFLFIFCFASGPAGATAPLAGDLFTQQFKSAAYIIACTINWICLFVVGMVFPIIVEHLQAFCFLIFLFFCISCGLFIKFNVPEIKNLTALQIAAEFQKMHAKGNESKTTEVNKFPTQETKL